MRATQDRRTRRSVVSFAAAVATLAAVIAAGLALLDGAKDDPSRTASAPRTTPAAGRSATAPSGAGSSGDATSSGTASPATPSPSAIGPVVGGWYAGASGLGVADGAFAAWLGQPVRIAGTWADQDAYAQTQLTPLSTEYRNWTGAIDLSVAGTVLGSDENYAAAARGAYDARWRTAGRNLATYRGKVAAPTFVRPFHEANGSWYANWRVTKRNVSQYKAAFRRYVGILRQAMPTVYVSWSPNFRDFSGLPVESWYPGDDVVDCVAPDYYRDSPKQITTAQWNATADDVDANGNPLGPEAWRRFAAKHGKPLCFPETGLKPVGGITDQPQWISAFNAWLNAHANTTGWHLGDPIPAQAAGTVLYSVYFNVPHEGMNGFTIYGTGANPRSAKVFRALRWGRDPAPS